MPTMTQKLDGLLAANELLYAQRKTPFSDAALAVLLQKLCENLPPSRQVERLLLPESSPNRLTVGQLRSARNNYRPKAGHRSPLCISFRYNNNGKRIRFRARSEKSLLPPDEEKLIFDRYLSRNFPNQSATHPARLVHVEAETPRIPVARLYRVLSAL